MNSYAKENFFCLTKAPNLSLEIILAKSCRLGNITCRGHLHLKQFHGCMSVFKRYKENVKFHS